MKRPDVSNLKLNTSTLRAWAVVNAQTGHLRMRAVQDTFDDWQAKIYSTKKIALRYAWPDEAVVPVKIVQRPGRIERGN